MCKWLISLWLILIASVSCAQTDQVLAVQDFTPGLNMSVFPDVAPPGTFTILRNFILMKPGRLQKRWAFTYTCRPAPASTQLLQAMYLWDQGGAGTPRLLVVSYQDSIYWTADTTMTVMSRKGLSTTYDFAPFKTKVAITGDVDSVYTWGGSGSTLTVLSNAPDSVHYLANYKNYLWLGNEGSNLSRVWFSNLGDETTWGANDYIDVEPYDGDEIMGLAVYEGALIIFKRRAVYALTGDAPANFSVQRILVGIGCHDYRSIQAADGHLFWASVDGVYDMSASGVENIGHALGDVFDETTTGSLMPTCVMASATLKRHKQYWLAVGTNLNRVIDDNQPNKLFVYQYDTKTWTAFDEGFFGEGLYGGDFDVVCMTSGVQLGTQPAKEAVYVGKTGWDRVYRYPFESSTGDVKPSGATVAITSLATFAPLQGAMPHMMKRWNYLYMTAITTAADTISVSGINTPQTYTMSSGTNRFRVPLDTRSKALGVTITHATRAVADLGNFLFTYTLQQFEQ